MSGKILNVPNIISILKILIVPLISYLFVIKQNYMGLAAGTLFIFWDIIDGYLARKLNQLTTFGLYLDHIGDNFLLATLFITFYLIGYVDLQIIALLTAHRLTRLALVMYIKIYGHGFYTPKHIKSTGFIIMLYVFFIPFLYRYFNPQITAQVTYIIVGLTYIGLLISVFVAIRRLRKGKIKVENFEKIKIKEIISDFKQKHK